MGTDQVLVRIPRLARSVVDLDVAHAPLHQPAGDQGLATMQRFAVQLADLGWLLMDVESVNGFALHAEGQLHRFDPRIELRIALALLLMPMVQLLDQVELMTLLDGTEGLVLNVRDQFFRTGRTGVDMRSLIDPREEGTPPVCRFGRR